MEYEDNDFKYWFHDWANTTATPWLIWKRWFLWNIMDSNDRAAWNWDTLPDPVRRLGIDLFRDRRFESLRLRHTNSTPRELALTGVVRSYEEVKTEVVIVRWSTAQPPTIRQVAQNLQEEILSRIKTPWKDYIFVGLPLFVGLVSMWAGPTHGLDLTLLAVLMAFAAIAMGIGTFRNRKCDRKFLQTLETMIPNLPDSD